MRRRSSWTYLLLPALLAPVGCSSASASARPRDSVAAAPARDVTCDPDNGGITLPPGFCATIFADHVGQARHLVVAANGDVFVALNAGRGQSGGVLVLRDTSGDGHADVQVTWPQNGGTGIALTDRYVYFAPNDAVLRYPHQPGSLEPAGPPDTIVESLPVHPGHTAKPIALLGDTLFVTIGSPSNSCQEKDRSPGSPGLDPCPQLDTRAGIWRFDANKTGQTEATGTRFATGIRNAVALTVHPSIGILYALQMGRDQLFQNWPKYYDAKAGAELPAEEFLRVLAGDDFGWPYCYYDQFRHERILAPEYGGDGKKTARCAEKEKPIMAFPGHWAPESLLFYTGTQFPAPYRGGAFIAFHGSWNRAPLPQQGYDVVFVPMTDGLPADSFSIFANGFAGQNMQPNTALHRPSGLAQGPDGSLYIADDAGGRIWKVVYQGGGEGGASR